MVSRCNAVKSIGSRAAQESSMPISIGGVGNSMIKSNHGIFLVRLPLFNGADAVFSGVCIDQITVEFLYYPLTEKEQDDVINSWFAEIAAVCWWSHRLHIGHQISRKSVSDAMWTHHLQIMVQKCC